MSAEILRQTLEISPREIEILALVAEGFTNQEISQRTGLTLNTVKWYLKELFDKLHVNNRVQAVARAREWNLFDEDEQRVKTNNLPYPLTPFVGRAAELRQIIHLLSQNATRLVTLHGLGGIGKTRLAIEAARQASTLFRNGVYFIPLVAAESAEDALQVIAQNLNLADSGDNSLLANIVAFLRHRTTLLVLDNVEQIDNLGPALAHLLLNAPAVRILVTSRTLLNLHGEIVCDLDGLGTQDDAKDAVALFERVALLAQPEFSVSPSDRATIAQICRLVEGMPLAIELAASWTHLLPVQAILREIEQSLDFLATDAVNLPERHHSVRAVMNSIWGRLSPEDRCAMARLSALVGSFTYEAACRVTDESLGTLRRLLSSALIRRSGANRFDLHELVRQYAAEQLVRDPDQQRAARQNHADYYVEQVQKEAETARTTLNVRSVHGFVTEMPNVLHAWDFLIETCQYDRLLQAADLGYWFEVMYGWHEGYRLMKQTLDTLPADAPAVLRGRLLTFIAIYAFQLRRHDEVLRVAQAVPHLLEDTAYAHEAAISHSMSALCYLFLADMTGFSDAAARAVRSIEQLPASTNSLLLMQPSLNYSLSHLLQGQFEAAISGFAQTLDLMPPDATYQRDVIRIQIGECYLALGDHAMALQHFEAAHASALEIGDPLTIFSSRYYLRSLKAGVSLGTPDVLAVLREVSTLMPNLLHVCRSAHYFGSGQVMRGQADDGLQVMLAAHRMLLERDEHEAVFELAYQSAVFLSLPLPAVSQRLLSLIRIHAEAYPQLQTMAAELARERGLTLDEPPAQAEPLSAALIRAFQPPQR
jgi:predicted ATPase/DNA-binding CsgD family transcriptional regulator